MAIVVSSLTDDMVDPVEMAKWSYDNGYWCKSSGSYHALIPAAAEEWGLPVSGCTTSEPQRILDALADGKLVVAIMSEGHFTSSGHFIVLRGVKDGQIMVADPASYKRSGQLWDLSIILNEASRRACLLYTSSFKSQANAQILGGGGLSSASFLIDHRNDGCFFRHLSSPVSYTHLDVYKRQVYARCHFQKRKFFYFLKAETM